MKDLQDITDQLDFLISWLNDIIEKVEHRKDILRKQRIEMNVLKVRVAALSKRVQPTRSKK